MLVASRQFCLTISFLINFLCELGYVFGVDMKTPLTLDKGNLQHLHILFRHGDRSPIVDVINRNTDPKTLWPSGFGQLSAKGVLQEFELGMWLRQKYGYFIPAKYNGSDFHMRSTDIDRTLMSAQSVLAGLYANASSPLVPFGLHWMPVPVHTVSQEADVLLSTAPCPCLDLLRKAQMDSEEGISFEKKHQTLFDLLNKNLNVKIDRHNVWQVTDTLICMKAHNIPFPDWCADTVLDELLQVDAFYWNLQFAKDPEIVQLEIGVFLSVVVDHLKAVVKGAQISMIRDDHLSVQHAMSYSAHDSDIVYLLSALKAYDNTLVPYSSAVVLELFGPKPPGSFQNYRLRLVYKRGYDDPVGNYTRFAPCLDELPENGCPLDKVVEYLEPWLIKPADFDAHCAVNQNPNSLDSAGHPGRLSKCSAKRLSAFHVYITVGAVLLVVAVSILIVVCQYRRRSFHDPDRVHLINPTA